MVDVFYVQHINNSRRKWERKYKSTVRIDVRRFSP